MSGQRIWINCRFLHARHTTGVQRYANQVTHRLADRCQMVFPVRGVGRLSGLLWEQFILPRRIPPGELLWSPANSGPLTLHHQAVTIHDLAVLDHPQWFSPMFAAWYRLMLPRLAHRSALILTVSQFSATRIREKLQVSDDKIRVIPPGVEAAFHPRSQDQITAVIRKYRLPNSYFLWIGTLEPRKNLQTLLKAWQEIRVQFPDVGMVWSGAANRNFRPAPMDTTSAGIIRLGFVDDADLPALISGALALVMPSVYEGFGLPALEAMACRTAVIASKGAGMLAEVGQAAYPIDPYNSLELASAMRRMLQDADLRLDLAERGAVQAHRFNWDQTAESIYRALSEL